MKSQKKINNSKKNKDKYLLKKYLLRKKPKKLANMQT